MNTSARWHKLPASKSYQKLTACDGIPFKVEFHCNLQGMIPMNDALSVVKDRLAAVAEVPSLQHSVKQHCENLEKLSKTLCSLGMDEAEIDRNVLAVFEEYERELLRTVGHMLRGAV
jgi:hypothetical protein